MAYDKGDSVDLTAVVTNKLGAATDPTNLMFRYEHPGPPSAVVSKTWPTDPEVVKDSVGNFHISIDLLEAGTWRWYAKATGAVKAATPVFTFAVTDQGF